MTIITIEAFRLALGVPAGDAVKTTALVTRRLHALQFSGACSRCGGSGHYSYNQMDGTRCYGCSGLGYVLPRLTAELLGEVEAAVAAGKLEPYFAEVRRRKLADSAAKRVMAAWTAYDAVRPYGWMNAANDRAAGNATEATKRADANRRISEAYDTVREAAERLRLNPDREQDAELVAAVLEAEQTAMQAIRNEE